MDEIRVLEMREFIESKWKELLEHGGGDLRKRSLCIGHKIEDTRSFWKGGFGSGLRFGGKWRDRPHHLNHASSVKLLDDKVVAFRDIKPSAFRHYLVIPVEHIPTVRDIRRRNEDYTLVSHMLNVGQTLLHRDAPQSNQYSIDWKPSVIWLVKMMAKAAYLSILGNKIE
ncbi:hypothetical protein CRYUN_Cryun13aG0135100 [Craigia yunnanensis]